MQRRDWFSRSFGLATSVVVVAAFGCAAPQRPDGGSGLLPVGAEAPNLSGKDQSGATVHLRQAIAGKLLVYFYPKDATPGCTKEACAFRDAWQKYQQAGVRVLGVSNDSVESHREFAKEQRLVFPLIADEDGSWARAFGVSSTAGFYSRVSFLIGKSGRVEKVYEDVDPAQHADEVLRDAEALSQ